ncbi:MAG TPA: serine/threonine-protein kinase, partial [Thermoanaerobaculia bacterium]|nr:serine/threonine-protein kinase [Thermoanaerobaculia bacterium]
MNNETQFPTLGFPEEPAELPPPTEIGEFQILSVLGKGGMGVVYEALQRDPERRVALKVLRGGRLADEMQLRLFRREAQTLARLIHPNIAAIYEAGRTGDGLSFFTMELVRGEPLDKYVLERMGGDRPSPAQLRERLRLFATICRAVAYAHQRGVIHRDLKPSNILVIGDPQGSSPSISISGPPVPTVKILDFGLARMTDNDVEATQLSRIGDIRGTLAYMSPEQARGDTREIDLRSDVYSLGVTLYETITGRFPYDVRTSSLMGVLKIIIDEPPKPLQQAFKGGYKLDPDLWTITEKALEKEPDRRYVSADALAEDIERYLANRPILAHPPSTAYQVRKLVSRHRFGFATAAGFLAVLVAGAILLAVQADRIRRERDRATQEAARATAINQFLQKTLGAADPWQRGSFGVTLVDALKQSEKQVHGSFKGQPLVEADVLVAIARTYHGLGEYADAERLLRSALATRIAAEGRETDGVAEALATLGGTLQVQRKADESEKLLRESLAIREKLHGRESREAAETLNELARTLVNKSAYKEAETLAREGLAIRERLAGPRSSEAADSHRTLCSLYTDQEEWKRALEECGIQVAIRRDLHDDGPELGGALNDVGVVQTQLGDYDAAEKTFAEAMVIHRRVLGEDHPEYASGLENIGNIWYRKGEYAKTAEQLEKVLAIRRHALGEDAEPVGRTMANLASVYMSSGNDAAALPKFRDGLVRLEKFLGPDHPDVASVLTSEAGALLHLGRLDEAEAVVRRALAIRVAKFPESSVPIALTRMRLGQILTAKKHYPEADEM